MAVEVIRKIRGTKYGAKLPIITMTAAYKGEQYSQKAKQTLAIKYYLEKPFKQEEFLQAIKDSLGDHKPKQEKIKQPAQEPEQPSVKISVNPPETKKTEDPEEIKKPEQKPKQVAEIHPRQAYQASISKKPMDGFLVDAKHRLGTGMLYLEKGDDKRTITLVNGVPIAIKAKNQDNTFGNFLFCQGKISLMEYQVYQSMGTKSVDPDELFIKMGVLLPDEYYSLRKKYLEDSLIQILGWIEGEYTFQLYTSFPQGAPLPPVNMSRVIHEGYKNNVAIERINAVKKRASGKYLALAPAYYDHQMHLDIEAEESMFLARIDGSRMFEELLPKDAKESERF